MSTPPTPPASPANPVDPMVYSNTSPVRTLIRIVVSVVLTLLVIRIMDWLLPGFSVDGTLAALAGVAVLGVLNSFIRPLLVRITLPLTVLSFGLISLVLNGLMLLIVDWFVPGFHVEDLLAAILVSFGLAIENGAILSAVLYHNDRDLYQYEIIKRFANKQKQEESANFSTPGLIIIEIDGLSEPLLRRAIQMGVVPFLAQWMRSGEFQIIRWDTGLPSMTSSMQAGILHGSHYNIPAFRFYDKSKGRLLVSNRPNDAAEMMKDIDNGEGILSHHGFGLNNWAHGNAEDVMLTFSAMSTSSGSIKGMATSDSMYQFFANAYNMQQVILNGFVDFFVEWREARNQRKRNILPRIKRAFPYPLIRVATTVLFPRLSSYLLIGKMFEGISCAYTTYVNYDEVAHHSGIERPDAFRVLAQMDEQIAWIVNAAKHTTRQYEFVILSDHGQSQGATFKQRYNMTLAEFVNKLVGSEHAAVRVVAGDEGVAGINLMVTELTASTHWVAGRLKNLMKPQTKDGYVELVENENEEAGKDTKTVVCASGNLGLIYFTGFPNRLTLEELDTHFPGLVDALARHEGIGFVMVRSQKDGAVAIGKAGVYFLDTDTFEGKNPLEDFGKNAARHLREMDSYPAIGDIMVNSMYDTEWDEVAAFEELVGSHGGLGGLQNEPFLMFPTKFDPEGKLEELVDASEVYKVLKQWVKDR